MIWDVTGSETGSMRTNLGSTGDQVQIMLETMSLNTIYLLIINQCAQNILWTSCAKISLLLTQKISYRDYLNVCSGGVIIPLWIPPLTGFQWLVRYDLYCSHKPYGPSEPPFSLYKGLSALNHVNHQITIYSSIRQ